jgi:hypothetical protein
MKDKEFWTKIGVLDDLELQQMDLEESILEDRGWKRNCNNPCNFWLWEKKIHGKSYQVDRMTALKLEKAIAG